MPGLAPVTIARALEPFGVRITPAQTQEIQNYLEVLLRWNRHINLTSVRAPEEIVARHFGESFYLARILELKNQRLVDVGSGAGFPGLAIKIVCPELRVLLVESNGRKVTFLKEVARALAWQNVEALQARFQELARNWKREATDIVTARAVGSLRELVTSGARILRTGGTLALYLGRKDAQDLVREEETFRWEGLRHLPVSTKRVILLGTKV